MCAALDPYRTLGLPRDASDADIKKTFKKRALETHPDRNSDLPPEKAQEEFAKVGNAYEVLKDPEKRREYDLTGRVDGGGGSGTHPGQAEHDRMVREWMRAMMQRQQRPPPKVFPQADMEAWVRADVASIHAASRSCNISTELDDRRAMHAGKLGVVAKVDKSDSTVKLRLMVSPGRAEELWFGGGAVWDTRIMEPGLDVLVCPDEEVIHKASRAVGIDEENDNRRARCAGKLGTVVKVDRDDQTAKVRVLLTPTKGDELWFAIAAIEPPLG